MLNYVLGFAFDAKKEKVVLIKKTRGPAELLGKLNGVGGKIEPRGSAPRSAAEWNALFEPPAEAMVREFLEETGVAIPDFLWNFKGQFSGPGYNVKVFAVCSDEILKAQTMEDEQVIIVRLRALPILEEHQALCPNVSLLVGLCLNPRIKRFSFEE